MNLSQWFHDQLQASADGFVWDAQQVPNARRLLPPPEGLGEWAAARHIFHMMFYEQTIALPSMRQGLGEPCPPLDGPDEDVAWGESKTYQHTAEHTNDVMRIALFWDRLVARQKANGAR